MLQYCSGYNLICRQKKKGVNKMQEIWTVYNKGADFKGIGEHLEMDPVLVRVMRNRDLTTEEEMKCYLGRTDFAGYDKNLLKDVDKASSLILAALQQRQRIRIIGDYDVDGITSSYILLKGLGRIQQVCKTEDGYVDYVIPHRMKDGYGLNRRLIEEAHEDGISLILTCDNGIAAVEEIALAKEFGMTVVVTDHHEVQETLPAADAIVNPKQKDCSYPFAQICGAVVAYKLIARLYERVSLPEGELELFHPYIAMATVCDVMPLRDENRYIVKQGLACLEKRWQQGSLEPGLTALIAENQLVDSRITAATLGFVLGPCLNAVGRLSTAVWGLKLLLEEDEKRAAWRAKRLTQMNAIRKEMSQNYEKKACELAVSTEYEKDRVLVLYLPKCHESIAGIVAGRVREYTGKPTLLITDSREKGIVKGSARSIPEYDMFASLLRQKELLLKFGGHKMAAGFSLYRENLEKLRSLLNQEAQLSDDDVAVKRHIDVVMPVEYITETLVSQMEQLEPFGNGNERPMFAVRRLCLKRGKICGKKNNVLRLTFVTERGKTVNGVFFSDMPQRLLDPVEEQCGEPIGEKLKQGRELNLMVSVLYQPKINEFQGVRTVELRVLGMKYEE